MNKIYLVTGGGFVVKRGRTIISGKKYDLENEIKNKIKAQFPEAAKNKAIIAFKRKLRNKYGKSIIVKQTTNIRVVTYKEPESNQKELFK